LDKAQVDETNLRNIKARELSGQTLGINRKEAAITCIFCDSPIFKGCKTVKCRHFQRSTQGFIIPTGSRPLE